ncbi:FAD-binding oxidoreductase [Lactococcus fujiensis]|uniref:FAD-binding oxidoreductase n=1 Tax=Lactococcus fujiensis TaxID=610251 RepID=UPI0015DF7362|nr:FAD-binding oxidoreductase [Lactococcus fujiensis]
MLKTHKYWLGLFWLFAIFVLPVPLLTTLSYGLKNTLFESNLFASQIGIIAYVWMLFVIAISTKPKWIDKMIGLPEMYLVHGLIGLGGVILALVHKMMIQSFGLIKLTGTASLILLLTVAVYSIFFLSGWLTSRIKILNVLKQDLERLLRYEISVWLHRLNIVATLLIFAHVILIPYIANIKPFMILFFTYSGITALMYLYYHFMKPFTYKKGILIEHTQIASSVTELVIQTKHLWNFNAGDFVYLSFPDVDGMKEMHPFSILNYDKKSHQLIFAIRNWGDFTARLNSLPKGTKVKIDGSYGRLLQSIRENKGKKLVFIGSGVGSVPLISLTISLFEKYKISFIRVASKQEDLIYESYLRNLSNNNTNFNYFSQLGRLKKNQIKNIVNDNKNSYFIVGGSTQMMMGTMKLLKNAGVKKSQIYGEKFNF